MPRVIKNWKAPSWFSQPAGAFKPNGHGRRYLSVEGLPFRDEAFAAFGLSQIHEEPQFKNFIGNHYLDKAATHPHTDPAPEGFAHVRVNWMLKKPERGGNPILGGREVEVGEGDLWICFASEELHASTPIFGGQRLICSFGALVEKTSDFDMEKILS
jgi:hypothetical protein